jgi:mannose-6-phosphate isomerase-like protein (cupin superfamily)
MSAMSKSRSFKRLQPGALMPLVLAFLMVLFSINSLADSDEAVKAEAVTDTQLPDPLQAGWQGEAVCEDLYEDKTNRTLRCTFPPGVGHEKHYHRPHFGYALSGGQMRLTDADGVREMDLKTDMSYYSDGVDWHEVLNIGSSTVQFLIVEQK